MRYRLKTVQRVDAGIPYPKKCILVQVRFFWGWVTMHECETMVEAYAHISKMLPDNYYHYVHEI